jgi:hypothetical protein
MVIDSTLLILNVYQVLAKFSKGSIIINKITDGVN